MLYMNGLGLLSAITNLSNDEAADAIWNSFSSLEKTIGGLTNEDYQKLRLFVNNLYTDGYVIQKFDNPSLIQKPSQSQIDAEVQRLNHGVYDQSELAKASQNVSRIMDKGFFFARPGNAAASAAININLASNSASGGVGDILKSIAGAFSAYSPLLRAQQQVTINKQQARLTALQKSLATQSQNQYTPRKDYTGWVLGIGGAALLGIVLIGILKRKK